MTTNTFREPMVCLCWCIVFSSRIASGQTTVYQHDWTVYASPATAISAQIHAEADFIRSAGSASFDFAAAREVRARAVGLETANSVAHVRAFWDRRAIWEAEKDKRQVSASTRVKLTTDRIWEQLKDHPELSRHEITQGTALNFLLSRLASQHAGSWELVPDEFKSVDLIEHLAVPHTLLSALRLRQPIVDGFGLVFRANDGLPLDVGRWPSGLRVPELSRQRAAFEQAKTTLFASAESPSDRDAALAQLQKCYSSLIHGFNKHYSREWRQQSAQNYRQYVVAKQFLDIIASQLPWLREIDLNRATLTTLRFEGETVADLVNHMAHRGLQFAPAAPGDEPAYFETFYKLRGLYLITQQTAQRPLAQVGADTATKTAAQ